MSAAPAPRSAAATAEPDAAEELETRAGEGATVIHLPDQSQPEPPPRSRQTGQRKGRYFGPRRVSDPKDCVISFRCTRPEFELFGAHAAAMGLAIGPYLRRQETGSPGPRAHRSGPTLEEGFLLKIQAEMSKFGSNHNQLSRTFNTTGEAPGLAEWQRIERIVQETCRALIERLRRGD